MEVETEDGKEPWLLLFKNETHNHPTEIEPFGGAATCIGGAIRDPLSGRSYVYGAMRVTGAADPLRPVAETLPGKLPQKKLVTTAAAGYSSYGNQIGLATGQVDELYHDGYAAKRMEIGAVHRGGTGGERPPRDALLPATLVILLGGRTGRDGCGGATGSSKSHTLASLETCGAEVQKGNAPEERKLQRLFRGARGLPAHQTLQRLRRGRCIRGHRRAGRRTAHRFERSQRSMRAWTVRSWPFLNPRSAWRWSWPRGRGSFYRPCEAENLEATVVATVRAEPRLTMAGTADHCGSLREFLNSNGAEKHITHRLPRPALRKGDARGLCRRLTAPGAGPQHVLQAGAVGAF